MAKLTTELLGLAGEFAVASELCRRGWYAQLTLGHHKRVDILVETMQGVVLIQVKAKQDREWPGVSGPNPDKANDVLVLVDFAGITAATRPVFYVVTFGDWKAIVAEERERHPAAIVDAQYQVRYPDGWRGVNLRAEYVARYKEQWEKIARAA